MNNEQFINRKLAVAPMLDYTDKHFRYLLRLLSQHTLLYTEMVTTGAVLYGDKQRILEYNPQEHPLALQLGGSDPQALAACAKIAENYGYDEVNLNIGCPSDRVQAGRFGACLMTEPELVAQCVSAMRDSVSIPVTVKTRLGIDQNDSYEFLAQFIDRIAKAGCEVFIIHARNAWLRGLSPKENREIPPLRYDYAQQIKQDFPDLQIVLNGGIKDLTQAYQYLKTFDGIMMGRAICQKPYLLAEADFKIYNRVGAGPANPHAILKQYLGYVEEQLSKNIPLSHLTRPILGLYHGMPGANAFRRSLSENVHKPKAGANIVAKAASFAGF